MLDPKLLRNDLDTVIRQLARRGFTLDALTFKALEEERKALQVHTQELQSERNTRSKGIGKAKAAGEDIAPLLQEVEGLGEQLKDIEEKLGGIQEQLNDMLMGIPNIPHESVPEGKGEEDNPEIRRWGEPAGFDFRAKSAVGCGNHAYVNRDLVRRTDGPHCAVLEDS